MTESEPGAPDPREIVPTSNSTGAPVDANQLDDLQPDGVGAGDEQAEGAVDG